LLDRLTILIALVIE
jgi:hypothetical protein